MYSQGVSLVGTRFWAGTRPISEQPSGTVHVLCGRSLAFLGGGNVAFPGSSNEHPPPRRESAAGSVCCLLPRWQPVTDRARRRQLRWGPSLGSTLKETGRGVAYRHAGLLHRLFLGWWQGIDRREGHG